MKPVHRGSTVSEMKYALMLGCPSIRVTSKLEAGGVNMTIETSHPAVGGIVVEKTFTLSEYLNGPMQPLYFDIYQHILNAVEAAEAIEKRLKGKTP